MAAIAFEAVTKRYDNGVTAVQELDLEVSDGEFLIFVGPSGCGKTTALRMVAGLERITSGALRIDGRVVNELPPVERDVAMVFQNYALYPNMTVRENMSFPLRHQRVHRREAAARVTEVASLLALDELLDRRPGQLSGGQRQRVAMGRALVRRPKVFLMDEPLSNLDAQLRVQMRAELISRHKELGITTVYVTHDQVEAMTLGERVAVMRDGSLQQCDRPDRLYARPANTFVASFVGSPPMNFVLARRDGGTVRVGGLAIPAPAHAGEALVVGVRPEDVIPGDAFHGVVAFVERLGSETIAHLRCNDLDVIGPGEEGSAATSRLLAVRLAADAGVADGDRIGLGVRVDAVSFFEPHTGHRV
jgi:ABC-type sugar transport system ATPase subunit